MLLTVMLLFIIVMLLFIIVIINFANIDKETFFK